VTLSGNLWSKFRPVLRWGCTKGRFRSLLLANLAFAAFRHRAPNLNLDDDDAEAELPQQRPACINNLCATCTRNPRYLSAESLVQDPVL
jgi:hypothetical protein